MKELTLYTFHTFFKSSIINRFRKNMLNIHFLTEQTAREPIFGGFSPLNFRKRWCLHLVDKVLYDGFLQRKTKCKNRSKKIRITFMLKTLSVIPKWFSSSCRFSPLLSSTLTHKVLRGAKRKWILNEIKNFIPHLKTKGWDGF